MNMENIVFFLHRYALNGVKSAALIGRKTENYFFSGVQLGIRQRLGEAKINLPLDIEIEEELLWFDL